MVLGKGLPAFLRHPVQFSAVQDIVSRQMSIQAALTRKLQGAR